MLGLKFNYKEKGSTYFTIARSSLEAKALTTCQFCRINYIFRMGATLVYIDEIVATLTSSVGRFAETCTPRSETEIIQATEGAPYQWIVWRQRVVWSQNTVFLFEYKHRRNLYTYGYRSLSLTRSLLDSCRSFYSGLPSANKTALAAFCALLFVLLAKNHIMAMFQTTCILYMLEVLHWLRIRQCI